jgi:hypothetical protein
MEARGALTAFAAVAAAVAMAAPAATAAAPTRYSLVHGCYALTEGGRPLPGAERVRMQATALGRYLLYRPDRRFVAARPDGSVGIDDAPSPAADWRVEEDRGGAFTLTATSAGAPTLNDVRFHPADGCADYPEARLDATGTPSTGDTTYGRVGGLVEGHMHWMTYEFLGGRFHCGRPWDAYGIPYALPDCSSVEGPQGLAAPMQNFLNYGNPAQPHDTTGWPTLSAWKNTNLTYEGTYWRWIERAWMAGLRLMVMSPNENRILCLLQANRQTNCDEMDTVRRSMAAIRGLQDYVDAQAGGPGKGFFQIVTDPLQARRVINQGRMAVVLEVEISEPFGCSGWDQPTCDQAQVDRQLTSCTAWACGPCCCSTSSTTRSSACASTAAPSACSSTGGTGRAPGRSGARRPAPAPCTTTPSSLRSRSRAPPSANCWAPGARPAGRRPPTRPRRTATRAGSRRSASTSSSG